MVERDFCSLLFAQARQRQGGPSPVVGLAVEMDDKLSGEREKGIARLTNDSLLYIVNPPGPASGESYNSSGGKFPQTNTIIIIYMYV